MEWYRNALVLKESGIDPGSFYTYHTQEYNEFHIANDLISQDPELSKIFEAEEYQRVKQFALIQKINSGEISYEDLMRNEYEGLDFVRNSGLTSGPQNVEYVRPKGWKSRYNPKESNTADAPQKSSAEQQQPPEIRKRIYYSGKVEKMLSTYNKPSTLGNALPKSTIKNISIHGKPTRMFSKKNKSEPEYASDDNIFDVTDLDFPQERAPKQDKPKSAFQAFLRKTVRIL